MHFGELSAHAFIAASRERKNIVLQRKFTRRAFLTVYEVNHKRFPIALRRNGLEIDEALTLPRRPYLDGERVRRARCAGEKECE
jgi:hypothetical protein